MCQRQCFWFLWLSIEQFSLDFAVLVFGHLLLLVFGGLFVYLQVSTDCMLLEHFQCHKHCVPVFCVPVTGAS